MPRALSRDTREIIIKLLQQGKYQRDIAEQLDVSRCAVQKAISTWKKSGALTPTYSAGRPRKTTPRDDRVIIQKCLSNRHLNSTELTKELKDRSGTQVSSSTVRRRLLSAGLKACRPRKKPLFSKIQRKRRLEWTKDKRFWTFAQWRRVLFSDESRFTVQNHTGSCYVRRQTGEEYSPLCTLPTIKHPQSLMVWGCMTADGVGRLTVCDGMMNGQKYISTLKNMMLPSARELCPDGERWYYQDDNAPCHRAKRVADWMKSSGVKTIDWPAQSPDLNPIENLWFRIGKIIAKDKPRTKRELTEKIINAWNHVVTKEDLTNLVRSMPKRCQDVIKNKGWPIKY